jgi:zinc protease
MIRAAALLAIAAVIAAAQNTPPKAPAAVPRKPATAAAATNYSELKYPALRPIVTSPIESVTLPNGMRLFLSENHELPVVNGTVLVRTGSAFDPPEKTGLAQLTGEMMLEGGTTSRPGDGLTRRFQNLGAEIDSSVTENSLSFSFSALQENADAVLDALKDCLSAPAFPLDRLDLAKTRLRNTIAHRNDDGAAILRREFAATVYGKKSPYGARVEYSDVDRINRGDLVSFHQRYVFPKNVMLSLEGDFDAAVMKGRIAALFDDWKSEQPAVPEFPNAVDAGAPGKFLAVKKDALQSFFAVGQVGGDFLDRDYPALQIMADILGGGPQGRLNQRLSGAADPLSATWTPAFGHPGLFQVSGTIANPFVTTQVLQTVFEELNKIRSAEVSEQELRAAKSAALNSMVFAFDNQFSILPRLTEYLYFGFPADYTQQHQKALEGVTRADVLRVARERLDPSKMTTVVVANPTGFERPLESLGGAAVIPIDLTIPPPKAVEAALGDPVSQRRGKQLLARAQEAMGGAGKLAAVADYVQEIVYQFDSSAGGAQAIMTERWMAPGYLRQDNSLPAGKVSVYSDGKTGWVYNGQGFSALSGVQLKQVQSDIFRILFPLLLSDRLPNRKVNALDDSTVEISDSAGQIAKLVFDPATGLLKNVLYDAITPTGPASVIDEFSDYRDVAGLKLPFKDGITLSGKKFQDLTIRNIQLNTGLKLQDLERRP